MSQFPSDPGIPPPVPPPLPGVTSHFHPLPVVPPTMAGDLGRPPAKATWPMAIGVLSIVMGVLGALQAVIGMATPLFTGLFRNMPMPRGQANPFDAIDKYMKVLVPIYFIGVLVAGVLIVAGVGMIRRRAWSSPAAVWWSILKIVYAIVVAVVTGLMQKAQMESVMASAVSSGGPGPPPGVMSGFGIGIAMFTAVFTLLWLGALPVFMLIWFTRPGVKSEVASWREPQVS